MTAFPFTVFRIHLVKGDRRHVESEFTDLEAAVEHVRWLMRHNPAQRVTLDVIPPMGALPAPPVPAPVDDFQERLTAAIGDLSGDISPTGRLRHTTNLQSYRYPGQGRTQSDMALYASWERERGHTGENNPFETLVQKRSQQHVDAVEKAAEQALQGGEYGIRVDVYPFRTEARVDPTVPYGRSVEHQHMTDPQETWRPTS